MLCKLLVFFVYISLIHAQNNKDNLVCPIPKEGIITPCIVRCFNDSNCAQNEKCCSSGCMISCQKACEKPSCNCKYGVTYYVADGCQKCNCSSYNPCAAVLCLTNSQCVVDPITNDAKCVPVSLGECPIVPPGTFGICVNKCSSDKNCGADQKCCSNGCGHVCTKPCPPTNCSCPHGVKMSMNNGCKNCECINPCLVVKCKKGFVCKVNKSTTTAYCAKIDKNGNCPFYGQQKCPNPLLFLKNDCSNDIDCPDKQKCCYDSCKKSCFEPCVKSVSECKCKIGIPTLVRPEGVLNCKRCSCENPCGYKICNAGYSCVNKNVFCIRSPCRPVAECVPNRCQKGVELPNVFCGRGPNAQKCPTGYNCLVAPNDAYAVCCPNVDQCKNACKKSEKCILQSAQCAMPPCPQVHDCVSECPMYKCVSKNCLNGYAFDKNGCRICDCFQ